MEEQKQSRFVGVDNPQIESKRIGIFFIVTFVISWVVEFGAIIPMFNSTETEYVQNAVSMIGSMMFAPAFGALIARLLTKEGLVHSGFQFNFSQFRFHFLFGWFGMTALSFLGAVIYFLIFRNNYDANMTNFVANYMGEETDAVQVIAAYKTDLLIKLFTAPVLDVVNSFGEEWGWRAYLLPKLYRKLGTVKAVLLSGFLSGLWYAPLVTIGYFYGVDYPGEPFTGILAMCIFGTVTGIIYSALALRTGSIFPAVFAHSSMSVMMSQAANFTFDGGNYFVGPAPTGIIAGIPLLVAAVLFMRDLIKNPVKSSAEKKEDGNKKNECERV